MRSRACLAGLLFAVGCARAASSSSPSALQLRRVTLYQNGLGYFERTGHVTGAALRLRFARGELDDALKTMTILDRLGAAVAMVDLPPVGATPPATVDVGVRLAAGRAHDLAVRYAVPTPTWTAAYRVVLDEGGAAPRALLQAWAMIHNASQEDWRGVQLTLATGAPMSFALDLHTPQYVRRPDATARLAPAGATAAIDDEHAREPDRDGDGIPDDADGCPDALGPSHGQGGRGAGHSVGDGCPDPGALVVSDAKLEVLVAVHFRAGGEDPAAAGAQLDAVAATLTGNPDLRRLEVSGHASADEPDPWGLALRRAENVRAALIARGVDGARLLAVPYGATAPLAAGADASRRVDFQILARGEAPRPELDAASVQASAIARVKPEAVAGTVRYALEAPISIGRGASAMVSILDKPIHAEDAYLWRPDAGAPGSDRHPFRAVRLANTTGYTLEAGPIAVYARGTFVGDGLLGALPVGQTAWVPYAVDAGALVTVTTAQAESPVRIAAVADGVLTVELAGVRTTTYAIAAGHEPPSAIYLRHAKAEGYVAGGLPPGSVDEGDAWLVRVPLAADRDATVAVEERQPRERRVVIADAPARELGAYVAAGPLAPELEAHLRAAIAARAQLAELAGKVDALRVRIADASARAGDLRASLRALGGVGHADGLRNKLVGSLTTATASAELLARQLGERTDALATARAALADAIRELSSS